MKIKTFDTAKKINVDIANLFLDLFKLDQTLSFEEVWPEMDDAWLQTLLIFHGHKYETADPKKAAGHEDKQVLSKDAIKVLDKLKRLNKWGNVSITLDGLVSLMRFAKKALEEAARELSGHGIVYYDTRKDTISLISNKQKEIETYLNEFIESNN